ncbi:MAG: amidohydrolase family protein [Woeseiaceae bacterium]|nr:amidohydrolase family protein [Woeseiaceae bacterium]
MQVDLRGLSALLLCVAAPIAASEILTAGNDFSVDVLPSDGRVVMDLDDDIWILPAGGGEAKRIANSEQSLRRPRWSPDGQSLLYVAESNAGSEIRIYDLAMSSSARAGTRTEHSQDPSWHPDGERFVFASAGDDTGLDLWETDLPTGLSWRLTHDAGDETQPVWSGNGEHLAWIHRDTDVYSLVLRRRGEPATVLLRSETPLSSPAWRPDGSLVTYLRHTPESIVLEMVILSEPLLIREISREPSIVDAPVSWPDRQRMVYTANQQIRSRGFEDRRSRPIHFRAFVEPDVAPPPQEIRRRELLITDPPAGRLIIRSARLYDGIWQGYRSQMDVVIESGKIEAIENRRERQDGTILDLGNVTVLPGLIDANVCFAELPSFGAVFLAYGVTTIAASTLPAGFDTATWNSEASPGPRFIQIDSAERPPNLSRLADGGLDNLDALLGSRQATAFGHMTPLPRRIASMRDIADESNAIVAGSAPNGLPPGAGLHAELMALRTAGLNGEQVLHAAGRNAARALGVDNQIGTITPGALADLVLVAGDPLSDTSDLLRIVAVVRNGRFYSLVSLLERSNDLANVE